MNTNEQLALLIEQQARTNELLERIACRGDPFYGRSVEDEINAVRLQGKDLYTYFKAKEAAMPRRSRTPKKGT